MAQRIVRSSRATRTRWAAATFGVAVLVTSAPPVASALGSGGANRAVQPNRIGGTPSPTTAPAAACVRRSDIAAWPPSRRAGQIVMVAVQMDTPSTALDLVQQFGVGGILVRGVTPTLAADIAAISRSAGDIAPVFGADEEGGRAQRLRDLLGVIPSARRMAQKMTPTEVRKLAFAHGQRMREIGLTMNLAPVLDLDDTPGPAIGSRSFSSDPDVAARFGAAFAQGMLDAGVFPVVKHFPGLGHADNDSHLASASTSGIDTLRSLDIVPFRRVLAKMPVGVMVAHVRIRGFDEAPASVSSALVTGVIRGELGFRGLIVTDALSMLPIRSRFGVGEAAVTALRSGSDLLLFDEEHDVAPIIDALVSAAGDPEVANRLLDATMRVLSAKGHRECVPIGAAAAR